MIILNVLYYVGYVMITYMVGVENDTMERTNNLSFDNNWINIGFNYNKDND